MLVRATACALVAAFAGAGIATAAGRSSHGHATCAHQSSAGFPDAYADSLHSTRRLDDGLRVVTFHACERRNAQSHAGGRAVTFWPGFILASTPRCLHLKIWIDGASEPRRARIPIGRRC